MKVARAALLLLALVAVGATGFFIVTTPPPIAAVDNARLDFLPARIARGAELARLGDCIVCHTRGDAKAYAGGRPLATPFGTVYGTNITPDRETGIGSWSQAAFARAMREGIGRDGSHLYPAFPYDHFRRLTDDDLGSLYAFLMTREPVIARSPPNDLYFPLGFRPLLAGWKILFLHRDPALANSAESPEWNRGSYLVNGIAHCGACHTPRNVLGAEKLDHAFAGGEAEGWHAPALNTAAPAPLPWTVDAMVTYLTAGVAARREVAAGPMVPVTHDLSRVNGGDVRAIAVYMTAQAGEPSPERRQKSEDLIANAESQPLVQAASAANARIGAAPGSSDNDAGATVYAGACASCHDSGRGQFFQGALNLRLSTSVNAPVPDNLARIIMLGIAPADGERGPWMPAFGPLLTDDQLTALLGYVRAQATGQPVWRDVSPTVRKIRRENTQ